MMVDRKQHIKSTPWKRGSEKTRRVPHLKPLSVYSRTVFCRATDSCSDKPSWSPDGPSWNLKVELRNTGALVGRKRRSDDPCLDETCDTPPKKLCLAKRPSPDSARVIDSSITFRKVKLISPPSSSVPHDEIKNIEKTLSDYNSLGVDWTDACNEAFGWSSASLTDVHSSSPVIIRDKDCADVLVFDYDVDEIMCLSPIEGVDVSADGLEDFIQSCQASDEEQLPINEGHGSWRSSEKASQEKAECSIGKDAQTASDEGYVTRSYCTADPGESKVTTGSELTNSNERCFIKSNKATVASLSNHQTPPVSIPIMSTPLGKFSEFVKRSSILSPKVDLNKESWLCETVKSSLSARGNLDTGRIEGLATIPFLNVNETKAGNIELEDTSIDKSSVCCDKEKCTATPLKDEDVLSVSQQQADSAIHMMFREETGAEDSFESTLPLQVQVRSKVVLPKTRQQEAVQATAHQEPDKKAASEGQRNVFKDIPRPVVLYRQEDWEKEKNAYVDSVTRHMTDNTEGGVMTELLHLMNAVANQGRGSEGRNWQHPSDLTRRNYQLRRSSRLLSLDEWQNLNYRNHRRFAKVPQMFKRSLEL